MRAYVLPDPRLVKLAGRFVWLDLDTEKPKTAAPFLEKYPIEAWPTLLVIDPASEQVVLRWLGTATAPQVEKLLLDGERAVKSVHRSDAEAALARGDRLAGERDRKGASVAYREALEKGGLSGSARERAAESLVQNLSMVDDPAACADAAVRYAPGIHTPATRARAVAQGLSCALSIEDAQAKARGVAVLEPLAREALKMAGVLADDRSWLYDTLASAHEDRGDEAGATRVGREWLAFLKGQARRAPNALARSAFDGPMISAAKRAGDVAQVLPALQASQRDLPREYVPPTNLAVAYLALDRPEDALAAADRALALAEGPRRIRVYALKAEALAKLSRRDEAATTLRQAIREADAMPVASRPNGYLKRVQKLLQDLGGSAPAG